MTPAVQRMLERYRCRDGRDYQNALKEIIQEVALLGLWRSKFFEQAAFYGGSALRILYGLDRFSEDLDFSLLKPQPDFRLTSYLRGVEAELAGFGFNVTIEERVKSVKSAIESAFIKAGTRWHLLRIQVPESFAGGIHRDQVLTIKIEVDTDPPTGFKTEARPLLLPIPFSVQSYRKPDLFAGKLHAILQRNWKQRVKGRDYYDFVWYLAGKVPCHLAHLEQRLRQSGGWTEERAMKPEDLRQALDRRFATLDVAQARKDVLPFLKNPAAIDIWSQEFFHTLLPQLETI